MQPVILIGLIAVAGAAMGTGFLMNTEIMLNVQNFGFGSESLFTPISDANVDLEIVALTTQDSMGKSIFLNVIDCSFHYPDTVANGGDNTGNPGQGPPFGNLAGGSDSTVICKLTDINGNVIAEGDIRGWIFPSETYAIAMEIFAFPNSNRIENVHDVTIVALGPDPTGGLDPEPPGIEADPCPGAPANPPAVTPDNCPGGVTTPLGIIP